MRRGRPRTGAKGKQAGKKKVKKEVDYSLEQDIASWLRIDTIKAVGVSKSGHPTSCASIADIMTILFFHQKGLKFYANKTDHFLNDRFVLSKGHAAPILYSALYRAKVLTEDQLMSLRLKNSEIEGHPVPKIPYVDVATGSLGQGLSVSAGMAYSSKYFDKINNKIYCITGDGQIAQGSVWQAVDFARIYKLNNLISFIDVNALGQSQATMHKHDLKQIQKKFESFGWATSIINGHSYSDIIGALTKAQNEKLKPSAIIASTFKGKGFIEEIENKMNWHGKDLGSHSTTIIDKLRQSIRHQNIEFKTNIPDQENEPIEPQLIIKVEPNYQLGQKISTRKAYGNALLKARQSNQNVISLDGDVKNSTFSITLMQKYPDSFIQCFIAEQNMVGVTTGLSCRKKIPFCSTFAAFYSRAADQIRIAGISGSRIKMVGTHSGCSIGQDGPSQMALEDLGFFRSLPKGITLTPCDGTSTEKAVELIGNYKQGPAYLRISRSEVEVIYDKSETFELGKCKVIKKSQKDLLVIIACGVPVHQALKSYVQLANKGINVRVIDIFSMKPFDQEAIRMNIEECHGNLVVVEQHYPEGGLFEAVCAVAYSTIKKAIHLCVRKIPGSAKPQQQLELHEIDQKAITKAIQNLLKG